MMKYWKIYFQFGHVFRRMMSHSMPLSTLVKSLVSEIISPQKEVDSENDGRLV